MSSAATALQLPGSSAPPRIRRVPERATGSYGPLAVETAALAGLVLDPWQCEDIADLLSTGPSSRPDVDWQWSAIEGGLLVPRQNGKGAVIEAIVLLALFVLEVPLIVYTSHEFKTSGEMFRRIVAAVRRTPALLERVKRFSYSHGEEGIELREEFGGGRLRILARSKGSGRGFSAPLVILDEAYALKAAQIAALLPTIAAMPNPLVLSFSSAAMADSSYLHDLRRRALAGARVVYVDHSVDPADYGGADSDRWKAAREDPAVWAIASPGMGVGRLSVEVVETLFGAMDKAGTFDREMLGVFDPEPVEHEDEPGPLAGDEFLARADPASEPRDSAVALVVEIAAGGTAAAIGLGAMRADGRRHLELVDYRPGTRWITERLAELLDLWPDAVLVMDPAGPAVQLRSSRDDWHELTGKDTGEAFAEVLAGVRDDGVRWRAPEDIAPALMLAAEKGQAMVTADGVTRWSRKHSPVDIAPMVALTFAGWAGEYLAASGDPLKAIF